MKRSKYYIRVMRPTFQRAILTVEATSDQAALSSAMEQAERLTERDWARFEAVREPIRHLRVPASEGATGNSDLLSCHEVDRADS